ncbi:hypothetical protein D3C80_1951950 [compost metagenome]
MFFLHSTESDMLPAHGFTHNRIAAHRTGSQLSAGNCTVCQFGSSYTMRKEVIYRDGLMRQLFAGYRTGSQVGIQHRSFLQLL